MCRMMFVVVLPLALLSGCLGLGGDAPEQKVWTVEPPAFDAAPVRSMEGSGALFSATRLGSVAVNAPYDRTQFVVRKPDGTVAFDHYNVFAAPPSSLLRAPVQNYLRADGRLGHVVNQGSVVSSDAQVEVQVKNLSLDSREDGQLAACAAVSVDFVRTAHGPRTVAFSGTGTAAVDAQDRNFSRAFSQAFSKALDSAVQEALGAHGAKK